MKPKTTLIRLVYVIVIVLTSCKNETQKISKTLQTQEVTEDTLTPRENKIPAFFKSAIRPNEKLYLKKHYSDTVTFIEFNNYDFDEVLFGIKTKRDTVYLVSEDLWEDKFLPEDLLVITWKIDSLRPAGDPEVLDFTPFLVGATKIKNPLPTSKNVNVLWRENLYNDTLKTEVNTLVFNNEYLENISPQERAALGFVATFIGNECEWEGNPNETRSNLSCQFLTALKLGYQCSETHLGFLRTWFSQDTTALNKLKSCPTIPNTATLQTAIDTIALEIDDEMHRILVHYEYLNINTREGKANKITNIAEFEFDCESVTHINTQ
ncbi:MAG: hypothetical protein R2781_09455 [Flavobacteriaceae bacterium]